eukprot:2738913-Pyramimonas_sp.AAC.1
MTPTWPAVCFGGRGNTQQQIMLGSRSSMSNRRTDSVLAPSCTPCGVGLTRGRGSGSLLAI